MLENCLIAGNVAERESGGVYCGRRSTPTLVNCTLTENASGEEGAGILVKSDSAPVIVNCISWGNRGSSLEASDDSAPEVSYSLIEGEPAWPGTGNINSNPLFVTPGSWDDGGTPDDVADDVWREGDYRVQAASPVIDAGRPEEFPPTDITGSERPCGVGVDMGAYEFCEEIPPGISFRRGDANADGAQDLSDGVTVLSFLFGG